MSILNVNTIQPIGSGTTVTVAATELKTSNFITVGTGASVTSPSANVLTLGTNSAERLRITSAGNVGIGSDNPQNKLDVAGDVKILDNSPRLFFYDANANGASSATGGLEVYDKDGNKNVFVGAFAPNADNLIFGVTGSERARITSAGKVGINNTSPLSDLQVITAGQTEDGTFRIGGSAASLGLVLDYDQSGATVSKITANPTYTNTSSLLKICVDGDANPNQLVLKGDGKVGINATSPERKLEVVDTNSNGSYPLAVSNFIDSTANKGAAIDFRMTTGGNTRGELGCKWTSNSSSDGTYFYIAPNDGSTGNIEGLRITSSGHVLRPTMAAAAVTLSAGQTTLSTFNTSYQTLALNSEGYDNANNFNTSNYRFTAPETGFYQVGCNVQLENASGSNSNNWMYLYPIINGNAPGTVHGGNQADFDPTVTHYYNWTYTTLLKLSQNDYIEWKYRGNLSSVNLKGQGESIFYFYQVG